jgi:transposase
VCDKHGSLIDLEVTPANHDDRASALPMLPRLAELGFQGDLLADNGYKGEPFAAAGRAHDMEVSVSPGGTPDGQFIPSGVRWVVERLFAWLSRYRRLNTVFTPISLSPTSGSPSSPSWRAASSEAKTLICNTSNLRTASKRMLS